MKEMKRDETRTGPALIKVLGITALTFLMLVNIASAAPFAYVTSWGDDISVIDTASNTVTTTISVFENSNSVAVSPDGTRVYVTSKPSENTGGLSVIDTKTNTVVATVEVNGIEGIAVSPDGKKVYVTGSGYTDVIDTETNKVIATVETSESSGVVVSPDGKKVYVTSRLSGIIYIIDADTNTVVAEVSGGNYPIGIDISPDGAMLYIANQDDHNVSVMDTTTSIIKTTISVGNGPWSLAVTPDGEKIYVTNYFDDTVSVIDAATNTVTDTISVGDQPQSVAFKKSGSKAYVANSGSNTVSVIDVSTNAVTATIKINQSVFNIAVASVPLIRAEGGIDVYLIDKGEKLHFTSPEALEWNGYSFDDVTTVTSETLQKYPDGEDINISQPIIDKYHALGGVPIFGASLGEGEKDGDKDSAGVYCSYVNFKNGSIEYFKNGDLAGKAYAVFNPFYTKWASMGYAKSVLGYPIDNMSNEQTSKFGTKFRYQNFANGTEKGALEYNLSSGKVIEIHGAIFAKWGALGYANSELGLVTSDERDAVPSFKGTTGKVSDFENGHLHWHSSGDHYMITYMTYGDLDKLYIKMGGTASDLGFPIIDQKADGKGHDYCEFEGGKIAWDDSTGTYKAILPTTNTPPTTTPVSVTNTESSTPTISWTYSDADNDPQQQYELEVWSGMWQTGTKMWSQSQSSMYSSVTYGGYALEEGKTYYVRVRAFDGTDWSIWSETSFVSQPSPEPIPTKKVAVVLAKFSDSGTITSPDIETVKKRCELIQQYYSSQSYGAEYIDFDFYTTGTGDSWYEISETKKSGMAKLELKKGNEAQNEEIWVTACMAAGLEMVDSGYKHHKDPKGYDVALVLFPADFTSYSFTPSPCSVCAAKEGYGVWAHELGHSLYGLNDKGGDERTEGDVGFWGLMGTGYQFNPPAPVSGFDKNKTGWLSYKDIYSSGITKTGTEYMTHYLDDYGLYSEGLLRLNVVPEVINPEVEPSDYIFEGRRIKDGVATDTVSGAHYTPYILYDRADEGLMVYEVTHEDSTDYIHAISNSAVESSGWDILGTRITLPVGKSVMIAENTIRVTCLSEGGNPKIKMENFKPTYSTVLTLTTTSTGEIVDILPETVFATENSNLDVGMYVITSDGRRVGMDYTNNTFYNEIEAAVTSGNVLGGGTEWISIPNGIDAMAYVTVSPDLKALLSSDDTLAVEARSMMTVYDENGEVNKTEPIVVSISSKNLQDQYQIPLIDITSPSIITNLQFTNDTTWLNWTWTNPTDPDFNHTEIYLNGTFQTNTSAEYFNATGLQPETSYTLSTRTVDNSGNVNQTWVNSTGTTKKVPMLPVADFDANPKAGNAPLKVTFTDKSSGKPTSWLWTFGDGTRSRYKNAVHTYGKAGNYNATLTVYYGNTPSSKVVPITVTELLVADFNMNPSSGYAPLLVQFTDKSKGATAWNWDFGDGATSTGQSPAHTYSKVGTYTVTLKARNANGETSKVATVNVLPVTLPVADFESNVKNGVLPLSVQFKDKSSGEPASWLWDFGDGATSTDKNPVHTYSVAGTYAVSLTVTNAFGTDTVEEADYITVTSSPQLVADFSVSSTSGYAPLKVAFTDKSTGSPAKWEWTFGDGTRSKSKNIAHIYKKAGIYIATLKVTNANGATASKSTEITVTKYRHIVAK